MTENTGIDPRQIAGHSLSVAHGAAGRGQQKIAEVNAALSIAASLAWIGDILETRPTAPETLTVLPEVERVAGGCCCHEQDCQPPADDLLEFGFGIICNADHAITSGGRVKAEWDQAARKFIDAYNARVTAEFGGSIQDQLIQARAELEVMKSRQAREAAEALLGDDS
jgi:hypothetical protein